MRYSAIRWLKFLENIKHKFENKPNGKNHVLKLNVLDNTKNQDSISINFLSKKQIKISLNFAKKNSKWNDTEFFYGQCKTPIIKNCLSNLECTAERLIPMGDHIIFICKVINVLNNNKVKPLIYYNSQYL